MCQCRIGSVCCVAWRMVNYSPRLRTRLYSCDSGAELCVHRSRASSFLMEWSCSSIALESTRGPVTLTLGCDSFILMDAIELRRRGVELLSPVLVPYGFVYQAGEVDRGSGG